MTSSSSRSSGCFRGYSYEQKTLRAKLDHLIKWTRDLKSNIMKQSCKVLQTKIDNNIQRQIIEQIHDDLDEYKRKFDRELGCIHDLCDALNNMPTENLRDEILEALRRSPTYSSLERHINDDKTPRIRAKPRERLHPGQKQTLRTSLSTDAIKRKASQPIALQVIDTSSLPGAKRRTPLDSFKRSRSFTNVEHTETTLGMDYIEEDESDLSWKPFGPKKSILTSLNNEQSNDEQTLPKTPVEKPKAPVVEENNSSDEEFDVAWQRRAKKQAQRQAAAAAIAESPPKRTVRFSVSVNDSTNFIELDPDETTQDASEAPKDQNNTTNNNEIISLDDDNETIRTSTQQRTNRDNDKQIVLDSDDDDDNNNNDNQEEDIIALSDEEVSKTTSSIISVRKKPLWTTSEIEISNGNSQSQSLHNPYRIGIADPSLRSVFLPPPNSQPSTNINKKSINGNRKTTSNKRTNGK